VTRIEEGNKEKQKKGKERGVMVAEESSSTLRRMTEVFCVLVSIAPMCDLTAEEESDCEGHDSKTPEMLSSGRCALPRAPWS
jgi:hypothetical protein